MEPLLQWKSKRYYIIWVYVCILRYRACTALTHIANCVLSGSTKFFSLYLINGTILKNVIKIQSVFSFSLQRLSETLFILSKTERDMMGIVYLSSSNVPVNLVRFFWKFNFLYKFPKKYSCIKFHENPSSGSRRVTCKRKDGRTDRYDESNSRFSQFCERV